MRGLLFALCVVLCLAVCDHVCGQSTQLGMVQEVVIHPRFSALVPADLDRYNRLKAVRCATTTYTDVRTGKTYTYSRSFDYLIPAGSGTIAIEPIPVLRDNWCVVHWLQVDTANVAASTTINFASDVRIFVGDDLATGSAILQVQASPLEIAHASEIAWGPRIGSSTWGWATGLSIREDQWRLGPSPLSALPDIFGVTQHQYLGLKFFDLTCQRWVGLTLRGNTVRNRIRVEIANRKYYPF